MLCVSALEVRYPVTQFVLMEPDDPAGYSGLVRHSWAIVPGDGDGIYRRLFGNAST
jgi:hypothetical protein